MLIAINEGLILLLFYKQYWYNMNEILFQRAKHISSVLFLTQSFIDIGLKEKYTQLNSALMENCSLCARKIVVGIDLLVLIKSIH